LMWVEVAKR